MEDNLFLQVTDLCSEPPEGACHAREKGWFGGGHHSNSKILKEVFNQEFSILCRRSLSLIEIAWLIIKKTPDLGPTHRQNHLRLPRFSIG